MEILEAEILFDIIFWILKVRYFLKICPIFVCSVENFGKIYEKIIIPFWRSFIVAWHF